MMLAMPLQRKIEYGRFSRRLQAWLIDSIAFLAIMVSAIFIASISNSNNVARIVGFSALAIALLYEPMLVSLTGSTIGHYKANLRVVDNRSGGNLSLAKSLLRFAAKSVLGLYSLISMATTRRHQALHDLLTDSTVQIRDSAKAEPDEYVYERSELADPRMPSRWRRVFVIWAYLIGLLFLTMAGLIALVEIGMLSSACIEYDRCSSIDHAITAAIGLAGLAGGALVLVFGWRARLIGCRMRMQNQENAAP